MNIIYVSPGYNNPHLFPTYKKTFEAVGHTQTYNPQSATHCFIELISGISSYDQDVLKIIVERNIPIICFDNREIDPEKKQKWIPPELNASVYFIRTMMIGNEYPSNVYPYDWAYFSDCDFTPTTKEELSSRPFDVCYIGVSSPTRENVINGLVKDGRLKVKYIFNNHITRLSNKNWVNEYRESKMFIECEGGGLTSEKFLQLFSICPMLKVSNDLIMPFPFTDGINYLDVNKNPTNEDVDKIVDILADKDWLYDIYLNGIAHMKKYYTEQAWSNYVLDVIKKNEGND